MTIEFLFPKLCNLYGDSKNAVFLRQSLPQAEFVVSEITDPEPYFVSHDVDMIYLGSMSEAAQKRAADKLRPFKERIEALIDKGVIFLVTGNALEIFCGKIENLTTKESFSGLGIFDLTTKIDFFKRVNAKVMGPVGNTTVVGFKSQFSQVYGDNSAYALFKAERGAGINKDSVYEGVRRNNFIGTHMLGPILIVNPGFTEYLMGLLGVKDPKCALHDEAYAAYEKRLKEFRDSATSFER